MKENKFKLVHKKTGEIMYVEMIDLFGKGGSLWEEAMYEPSDFYILQYIGTHDKNNVDMYEGDVITCPDGSVQIMLWDAENSCYCADDLKGGEDYTQVLAFYWEECEITGSIYERRG